MSFDSTAIAITCALVGTGLFVVVEFYRHKEIEVTNSVVIFLAIYAVFGGGDLISAALVGDPDNLPKNWREYLGVAGVVGIGLSLQHIIKTAKKIIYPSRKGEAIKRESSS